jgi:hypothetical protein
MTEMNGTRRTARTAGLGKVDLEWVDPTRGRQFATCRILDLSAHGMRIETPTPIPAGTYVRLKSKEHGFTGNAAVKHCRPAGLRSQIGVAFSGFAWNAELLSR